MDSFSVFALDPGLVGVGLAAFGIAAFGMGAAFARGASRRIARGTPEAVDAVVRDLCALNARVAEDAALAALLVRFTASPDRLDRVERVRARAWFDAARRLHALLAQAAEEDASLAARMTAFAPSMGEAAAAPREDDGLAVPRISNVTLIDPEFMAWVEAMQARHRA